MKKSIWITLAVVAVFAIDIFLPAFLFPKLNYREWITFISIIISFILLFGILLNSTGYLMFSVAPKRVENTLSLVKSKPLLSFFIGILFYIFMSALILILSFLMAVIKIHILKFTAVALIWIICAFTIIIAVLSLLPPVILIGKKIKDKLRLNIKLSNNEFPIGVIAIVLVSLLPIPFMGFFIICIAGLTGTGAVFLSKFGKKPTEVSETHEIIPLKKGFLSILSTIFAGLSVIPAIGLLFGPAAVIAGMISVKTNKDHKETAVIGAVSGALSVFLWIIIIICVSLISINFMNEVSIIGFIASIK